MNFVLLYSILIQMKFLRAFQRGEDPGKKRSKCEWHHDATTQHTRVLARLKTTLWGLDTLLIVKMHGLFSTHRLLEQLYSRLDRVL